MASVQQSEACVYPLRRDDLGPMVVHLATCGYTWMKAIIENVLVNGEVGDLVPTGLIDECDLEQAELALEAGLGEIPYDDARWVRHDVPWTLVTPPELSTEEDTDDYPDVDPDSLPEPPSPNDVAPRKLATEDVEPFHPGEGEEWSTFSPSPQDWADYAAAQEEQDRIDATRAWIDAHPFREWLESQGGDRS